MDEQLPPRRRSDLPQNLPGHPPSSAYLALAFVSFFWGITWVASRQGVRYMPALQLVGIRQFLAGLLYCSYFIVKRHPWPSPRQWKSIAVLCVLNLILTNGLTTLGVKYISAGLGAIISAIFPFWIVLLGLFRSKHAMPGQARWGLGVGFAGVCLIFFDHLHDFLSPEFRLGILISVIGSISWAAGTLYTKSYAQVFNPYFSLGLQMLLAGVVVLATSRLTGSWIPVASIAWQSWAAIAFLVGIGSLATFSAYLYALQHLPLGQLSIYVYINPVVAAGVGALFFQERLTWLIGLGACITLSGVALVNWSFRRAQARSRQPEGNRPS